MLYSEMVTTGALIHGDRKRLLSHASDEPCAVQLGGSDPEALALSAKMVEEAGYQEVNLNCGCPSDRVQQGGIGACLMAEPKLISDCYGAMADATSIPITIKTRIGIDDRDDYTFFHDFIREQYSAGCRDFQIHARKAILKGLSPKQNREIPPLKYDYVRQIQADFPAATFILNGGINTVEEVRNLLLDFQGVMLGRAPYSNPYLMAELEQELFGNPLPDKFDVLDQYIAYMKNEQREGTHIKHMAKHLLGLFTGLPGARAFRRYLSNHMFANDADVEVVRQAAAHIRRDLMETGT
jgi:tRNA-dihydrouridine synthase A